MQKRWTPILLTISQAYLAGAFPAPQYFGQSGNPPDPDCDTPQNLGPAHSLTSITQTSGANGAAAFTHGPPIENSYPQGNPFHGSGSGPANQPNQPGGASSWPAPAPSHWDSPSSPQESSSGQAFGPPLPTYGPSTPPATPNGDHGTGPGGNSGGAPDWNNNVADNAHETWASQWSSEITFVDPHLSLQTVTMTDVPSSQAPTITSASQNYPDTTGSLNPTLETEGNPASLPFPTDQPTVSSATLSPLDSSVPFGTATGTEAQSTTTETVTLPLTTFETVVFTETVTSVPVQTTAVITAVTVFNTTITSDGSVISTSTVGPVVITTTGTALIETTLTASSTITGTIATTVTTDNLSTNLPSATASCVLSLGCYGQDIFQPVAIGSPPNNIGQRGGHPVPRLGINVDGGPIETNKFYQNFVLGSQGSPGFVLPYTLRWSQGSGNAQSWGMAISHIDDNQKSFGAPNPSIAGSPNAFYINPLGIESIILSAAEFGTSTVLTADSLLVFSANIHLQPSAGSPSVLTFPLVQGMGFITGQYVNLQPAIQSSVFFRSIASAGSPKPGVFKYRVTLEDGKVWLLYAVSTNGISPNLQLITSTLLQGIPNWYGDIQVAKLPDASFESIYDKAVGAYPTSGTIGGYAHNSTAQYSFTWKKGGAHASTTSLLMFALPHHVESFESDTLGNVTNLVLDTLTKGVATAVVADYWVLEEKNLPTSLSFAPWRPDGDTQIATTLSPSAISAIQSVAAIEASQNMSAQSNLNSMYYSGKALSKFATLCFTMHDLTNQQDLAKAALLELESAFEVFSNNLQEFPLFYDTDWKGIVSSASYVTGDAGVDFGNSYYNDHHFHWGYFIHAAAVIGYLDPTWLMKNKDWVNALVRDVANPSSLDQYFPVFRSFDFFQGHSWAKGLFESGDGKDEESSSEDAMFAYALKMWGKTIGDASMEARGNLMLSLLARSLHNYFLMDSDNANQPSSFINNKVTGILFENKADHATYFGADLSYIQG